MADFRRETWKPEDNGVIFPRAVILHPVKKVLKMGKIKSLSKKQRRGEITPADIQ